MSAAAQKQETYNACWNCGMENHHRKLCVFPTLPGARKTKKNLRLKNAEHIDVKHARRNNSIKFVVHMDIIQKEIERLIDQGMKIEDDVQHVALQLKNVNQIYTLQKVTDEVHQVLPRFYEDVRFAVDNFYVAYRSVKPILEQDAILEGKVCLLKQMRTQIWEKFGSAVGQLTSVSSEVEHFLNTCKEIAIVFNSWRQANPSVVISEAEMDNRVSLAEDLLLKVFNSRNNLKIMGCDSIAMEEKYAVIKTNIRKWIKHIYQTNLRQENEELLGRLDTLNECAICLIGGLQKAAMLCGHQICVSCVDKVDACPMCRSPNDPYIILF